jgi:phosphoglycolate phosphatase
LLPKSSIFPQAPRARRSVVVFDLDGTLVDSAPDIAAAVNALLAEEGLPALPFARVRTMIGDGMRRLVARALEASGERRDDTEIAALSARCLTLYEENALELTRPFAGVAETLGRLAATGYRLAVCTNKPDGPARVVLEGLGLARFFATVVGGATAPALKPDVRALAHTLGRLSAGPEAAVMVGDSANDVGMARSLRVPAVCMTYGYSTVPVATLGADLLLDDFGDLIAALADLRDGRIPGGVP